MLSYKICSTISENLYEVRNEVDANALQISIFVDEWGDSKIDYDEAALDTELEYLLEGFVSDFHLDIDEFFDSDEIISEIDKDEIIDTVISDWPGNSQSSRNSNYSSSTKSEDSELITIDPIDDLFDRS